MSSPKNYERVDGGSQHLYDHQNQNIEYMWRHRNYPDLEVVIYDRDTTIRNPRTGKTHTEYQLEVLADGKRLSVGDGQMGQAHRNKEELRKVAVNWMRNNPEPPTHTLRWLQN